MGQWRSPGTIALDFVISLTLVFPSIATGFLLLLLLGRKDPFGKPLKSLFGVEIILPFEDAPAETLLGTVTGNPNAGTGSWTKRMWAEAVTENPAVGSTEVWEFYNATADAHPMHIHEVFFEVVNRQDMFVDEATQTVQIVTGSVPTPPEAWEVGLKDTVIAYPSQVTRVKMTFKVPGQYVWHCHIVDREDNEMMRPYRIGPEQPGQPLPHGGSGGGMSAM